LVPSTDFALQRAQTKWGPSTIPGDDLDHTQPFFSHFFSAGFSLLAFVIS
jgi:hypothetical protein